MNNSFTAFRNLPGSTITTAGLDIAAGAAEPVYDLIILRPAEIGLDIYKRLLKKYRKH